MTFRRMRMLVDTYLQSRRLETFEFGLAVNAAMSDDPKKALENLLYPKKELKMEDLPPMLRIPKKKRKQP